MRAWAGCLPSDCPPLALLFTACIAAPDTHRPRPPSSQVEGRQLEFSSFFAMKADKAIDAGQHVLHTYGDLSDAQVWILPHIVPEAVKLASGCISLTPLTLLTVRVWMQLLQTYGFVDLTGSSGELTAAAAAAGKQGGKVCGW